MDIKPIIAELEQKGLAGRKYELEGHTKFRDCLTVGRGGQMIFERYCYGEAAGLVFSLYADRCGPDGAILWKMDECDYTGKEDAPRFLTGIEGDALQLDEKKRLWRPVEDLRTLRKKNAGVRGWLEKFRKK